MQALFPSYDLRKCSSGREGEEKKRKKEGGKGGKTRHTTIRSLFYLLLQASEKAREREEGKGEGKKMDKGRARILFSLHVLPPMPEGEGGGRGGGGEEGEEAAVRGGRAFSPHAFPSLGTMSAEKRRERGGGGRGNHSCSLRVQVGR